jgi:hypothetical protein
VGAAAGPSEDDRERIRHLLARAHGYGVFERQGRRIGAFIELSGSGSDEVAIRRDGVFLWRRRLLPVSAVATVLPEQRAVVLNVDRDALDSRAVSPTPAAGSRELPSEGRRSDADWHERVLRYGSARATDGKEGNSVEDRDPVAASDSAASPSVSVQQPPERDRTTASRHLLFVSTSRGYELVEREGPPPAVLEQIAVPEHTGLFRVAKLAPSPLPNDERLCAYVEQTD